MHTRQRGLSLIELLIVVAIIAALVSISIPAYRDYIARGQVSEAATLAGNLKLLVADAYANQGTLAGINSGSAGIPANLSGPYSSVEVTDGIITATLAGNAHELVRGNRIILTPRIQFGQLLWSCSWDGEPKHAPKQCR